MRQPHLTSLLLLTFATPLHAAEPVPSLASSIGQMLIGLTVVIALLLGSLWLIKRLAAPRGAAAGLKLLGGMSIGSRERIVLVEVADKVLVLGVTAASVSTLHTLNASELPQTSSVSTAAPAGEFSRWLKHSMERRKNAG
ncbi:MAG TPA: flagellar biosynthetic protein FliO [Rhodocyclaceae bacterium]|nr:flagellar biosynthetic protein FliO [Rhodocyclaceae bacterium]HRQ45318.1 flagellar biosynthetic protein FliO [Rhodocyclaceae bacterium]